jgi:hypothetical protein
MLLLPQERLMRTAVAVLLSLLCWIGRAGAGENPVTGRVTYLAAGVIYTSLGRAQGLTDSSRLWVLAGRDTAAVLRILALSSHSSACSLVSGPGEIAIGTVVTAIVSPPERSVLVAAEGTPPDSSAFHESRWAAPQVRSDPASHAPDVEVKGRIGAQFRMIRHDESAFNLNQPGVVFNLQARGGSVPISADLYANLRTASYGNSAVFGSGAINQSRIYRAALSYDAGSTRLFVGRTVVPGAPAVGMVDGGVVQQRVRAWTLGAAFGFQPDVRYQGVSTEFTKAVLFASYEARGAVRGSFGGAYSRVYFGSQLDREVIWGGLNLSLLPSLSLYGNAEVDLRRKRGEEFVVGPALSSLYAYVSYRALPFLTVGVGGDAARPVYSFAAVRALPDSLLERTLSWGGSLIIGLQMPGGVMLSNTTTVRPGDSQPSEEYADFLTVTVTDVARSGITLRSNLNVNRTEYTSSLGFGGGIQKTLFDVLDLVLRHQRYEYTVRRSGAESASTTTGVDAVVSLGARVVLYGSYEWTAGYGSKFRSLFAEMSVRF